MSLSWQPSEENIEKCNIAQAKFMFEQAEKFVKDTAESSNLIVSRTTTLISISGAIMLALTGYLFNSLTNDQSLCDLQLATCVSALIYVFCLCFKLAKNLAPEEYNSVGAEPKKLFTDVFIQKAGNEELKYFYINEIAVCQRKIETNTIINDKRWERFNQSIKILLFMPIVIGAFYFILKLLFFGF